MHLVALLLLGACTEPPTIDGKVVDIWGEPIAEATVLMEGQGERPVTDNEGRYSFAHVPGKHVMKAGKQGYIQAHADLEVPEAGTDKIAGPTFELYKQPEEAGFYVIGSSGYTKLDQQMVHTVGSDFDPLRGLKATGSAKADHAPLTVLFHTELRYEEILKLGLELHGLEFVEKRELAGPLGKQEVDVNLHVSKGEHAITIEKMRSPTDYLITVKGDLEPGWYAFQTQDLLDSPDQDAFDRIPEELRQVFPFEYKK